MSKRFTKEDMKKLPKWAREQIEKQLDMVKHSDNGMSRQSSERLEKSTGSEPRRSESLSVRVLRCSLPIYMIHKFNPILLGMNIYRNAHWSKQHTMKKFVAEEAGKSLPGTTMEWDKFTVDYRLYYKNPSCDPMNVIAFLDKALIDAIQDMGIVSNDSVKEYKGGKWCVMGRDKKNPRLECVIKKKEVRDERVSTQGIEREPVQDEGETTCGFS